MGINIMMIPGMGSHTPCFSNEFEYDVRRYLKNTTLAEHLTFIEVLPFYEIGVNDQQRDLFDRMRDMNRLDFQFLRKFALSALGDAVTFEHGANRDDSVYKQVHRVFKEKIEEVNEAMDEDDILVIVASSLGVHMINTYMYDADSDNLLSTPNLANNSNNLSNLKYLASIGCNLPIFLSGIPENKIVPIKKNKRAPGFIWENFYDRDDILGWPLSPLCDSYNDLVIDRQINTGLTPFSHRNYWRDNDFTKPFSNTLKSL